MVAKSTQTLDIIKFYTTLCRFSRISTVVDIYTVKHVQVFWTTCCTAENGALLSDKIRADFPLHVCRSILLLADAVARDTLFSYHINIISMTPKQHNI